MKNGILLAMVVLVVLVAIAVVACGGDESKEIGTVFNTNKSTQTNTAAVIEPTWINPTANGDTLSIAVSEVDTAGMTHFAFQPAQGNKMNFMAYNYGGQTYVRANVCPPCGSVGFTLAKDILVCKNCGTRFKATTGDGVSGACKDYPKDDVTYTVGNGQLQVNTQDLLVAYQNTVKPGRP